MDNSNGLNQHFYQVVVLGGGPAGVVAALRARELGANVALVERGSLGGTCTNDGCVPTRALAHAARLIREYGQFSAYGLKSQHPILDFAGVMQRANEIVQEVHEKKQLIGYLKKAGVSVITNAGDTSFIDYHTIQLQNGTRVSGEKFIICAGGHPRRLDFPGSEYALTVNNLSSLKTLPRSVAIIGGAATGSQLATIFSAFGSKVTVLEVMPRILAVEDEDVSETMSAAFNNRGIQVIPGIGWVERITKGSDGMRLEYRHMDQVRSLTADLIFMSAGWVGNMENLNLPVVGVNTSERGYIQVNDYLQTSAPNIFAAGDITGRMMLVQSASYDGRVAAENAVLGIGQPYKHLVVPHGGFTDPEYGSVGLTEKQARAQGIEITVARVPYQDLDRAVVDDHTEGFCKLIVSNETHRVLGAHVVGEQALEVIQMVASGMVADMWIEQLSEMELPYPTYTAIVGLTARLAVKKLGVMPLAPQWQSLTIAPLAEWERRSEGV